MNKLLEILRDEKTEPEIRGEIFIQTLKNIRKMESQKSYADMISGLLPLAEKNRKSFVDTGNFQSGELKEYLQKYDRFQEECEKYQIWLVGTEGDCQVLMPLFHKNLVHILGVVDRVHPLLSECDYIFVCSNFDKFCGAYMDNRVLGGAKIVRFDFIWKAMEASPESSLVDLRKVSMLEEAEGIVTGMSYCQRGICFDRLEKKLLCLARPSQDYYIDYQEVLWAYDEIVKRRGHSLKYCVIEMNFYRLWYDGSLSNTTGTTLNTYLHTGLLHHMSLPETWLMGCWEDRKVCMELMGDDFVNNLYEALYTNLEKNMRERAAHAYFSDEEQYKTDVPLVGELFDKNYPETFQENIGILRRMIKFLKLHGVHVLLYLPPFPQIYLENASAEMRETTYQVLEELQAEFGLECLDLTQCEAFTGEHFADYHHLNDRGAELATEYINQFIRENL